VIYRAAFTYHPGIGTFRGQRGAWRVARTWPVGPLLGRPPCTIVGPDYTTRESVLFMGVARRLHVGTFVNPTKLLRELFAKRRGSTPTTKE